MNILAIDTEYDFANTVWTRLDGYSYSWQAGKARWVPWSDRAREQLQYQLTAADIVIEHNQVSDSMVLEQAGVVIPYGKLQDTLVMAHVLGKESLSLKELTASMLGRRPTHLDEVVGSGKKRKNISEIPHQDKYMYACADADNAWQLFPLLMAELEAQPELMFVYDQIERPLFPIVVEMQRNGVVVDWSAIRELDAELEDVVKLLTSSIRSMIGRPLNLNSNPDLHRYVYDELGYPRQLNASTQHTTLDAKAIPVLQEIRNSPFLEYLLEYRKYTKARSTYTGPKGLIKLVGPDGRLHPTTKQAGPRTGRTSSADPNFQNIPVPRTDNPDELGARIRRAFTVPSGFLWVGADYSQIELRALAEITQDSLMIATYQDPKADYHKFVVDLTRIPRRPAKVINFGRLFGQGEKASYLEVRRQNLMSGQVPPTEGEFHSMWRLHQQKITGMKTYERMVRRQLAQKGYVQTWFGRHYQPASTDGHDFRSALSMPAQGTAADLAKLAMPNVWLACRRYGAYLFGFVHDEYAIACPVEAKDELAQEVKEVMENVVKWLIPILAEVKIGANWAESH